MRKVLLVALAVLVAAARPARQRGPIRSGGDGRLSTAVRPAQSANGEYVVAYADGVSAATARAAVKAAGGTILKENTRVGVATVKSTNPAFITAAGNQSALVGAARNRPIGKPQRRRRAAGGRGAPDRSGTRHSQELGVQDGNAPTRNPWPTSSGACG